MSLLIFTPLLYTIRNAFATIILHLYFAGFQGFVLADFHGLTRRRFGCLLGFVNSILLAIKRPAITQNASANAAAIGKWWKAIEKFDSDAATNKGVEVLNAGTYLIRSNDGLLLLADGIRLAHGESLEYKVLFFEQPAELPAKPS
jgi:hypothetical protein